MMTTWAKNRALAFAVGAPVFMAGTCACSLETIDLREPENRVCTWRERRDPSSGNCAPCTIRSNPSTTCPCGYQYVPADFPYCDTADAYFECEPCVGTMADCNLHIYNPAERTSADCPLLQLCCDQLTQSSPPSVPCCAAGKELNCVSGVESSPVACWDASQALADCCPGVSCASGPGVCQPWQTCVEGFCRPGCNRNAQKCELIAVDEHLTCDCVPL
ncbi:MAG: hypothetical protein A2289_01645 [Deltaproteobacteria bacterium RIFOXYA12_FULL_58_15]|nr:MAG: hypothetical protein A2289_01645 [Deltaproteobacteria bacterium RIFOXYA12_FULL_58_15]OGR14180.1 MAG: hypothetical protein A2341_28620 [Deltaproteobacteria bacterium RIFOXYB12_FULL_58_9]